MGGVGKGGLMMPGGCKNEGSLMAPSGGCMPIPVPIPRPIPRPIPIVGIADGIADGIAEGMVEGKLDIGAMGVGIALWKDMGCIMGVLGRKGVCCGGGCIHGVSGDCIVCCGMDGIGGGGGGGCWVCIMGLTKVADGGCS